MSRDRPHIPVMESQVISLLNPHDGKTYLDATFGAGGHTRAILRASPSCKVIGVDRDITVLPFAEKISEEFPERFKFINGKFSEISDLISHEVDGAIFDVGISSMQINEGERGFSFMRDGPLTMTMGRNSISAYNLVNNYREEQLSQIILKYGDERAAPKIARAICHYRKNNEITRTLQLAEIIRSVIPRRGKIDPATLTFQAIRIFVNDELLELEIGLENVLRKLTVGGRVVVITFQGLEDKVVKNVFKKYTYSEHKNKFKESHSGIIFRNIVKGVLKPSREEVRNNTRARSAKIRTIVRQV